MDLSLNKRWLPGLSVLALVAALAVAFMVTSVTLTPTIDTEIAFSDAAPVLIESDLVAEIEAPATRTDTLAADYLSITSDTIALVILGLDRSGYPPEPLALTGLGSNRYRSYYARLIL